MCRWLLGAIALSMVLHAGILYIPPLALLFSVAPLGLREWRTILLLSAPVVLLDEVLKFISRWAACRPPLSACPEQARPLLLFSVAPLGLREWRTILLLSAPVVLLDEVLKLISR